MSSHHLFRLAAAPAILGTIALCAGPLSAESASPLPLPNPFHVDQAFKLELPPGMTSLGSLSGIKVGPDNNIM